jgi:probable HAF family extracellular repeat protein
MEQESNIHARLSCIEFRIRPGLRTLLVSCMALSPVLSLAQVEGVRVLGFSKVFQQTTNTSDAVDINDSGMIVGVFSTPDAPESAAYVASDSGIVNISKTFGFPVSRSSAVAINSAGVVTGMAFDNSLAGAPYRFENGGATILVEQSGQPRSIFPFSMNDAGVIVGRDRRAPGVGFPEAVSLGGGILTHLGFLEGQSPQTSTSVAYAINQGGDIVGESKDLESEFSRAFLFSGGVMIDLQRKLPEQPSADSQANDINRSGQIAGKIGSFGFLLDGEDVTLIGGGESGDATPRSINDLGVVVGDGQSGPFVFAGGRFIRLEVLTRPLLEDHIGTSEGFTFLNTAAAINNRNQIVGRGRYRDSNGEISEQAYRLDLEIDVANENIWIADGGAAASFADDAQWSVGQPPAAGEEVRLGNGTSVIRLDKNRAHPALLMENGGDHIFNLRGNRFTAGNDGVSISAGRLTVSNGIFDAGGQRTRIGSSGNIPAALVVSKGGNPTKYATGSLLIGDGGDGEVVVSDATLDVSTLLTMGVTPGAKGILRLDRGGLFIPGGASMGIPAGSGSRIIGVNSAIAWGENAVATLDNGSTLELRGSDNISAGGSFALRGRSELVVDEGATFITAETDNALVLNNSTAEFGPDSTGRLGGTTLNNGAILAVGGESSVTVESLDMAARGEAILNVVDGLITVRGSTFGAAAEKAGSKASLVVGGGVLDMKVLSAVLGSGGGSADVFVSLDGSILWPETAGIAIGAGDAVCKYDLIAGGRSEGGRFQFLERSVLTVDGQGSEFVASRVTMEPFDQTVRGGKAFFRNGGKGTLGALVLDVADLTVESGAAVAATSIATNFAGVTVTGAGSLLALPEAGTAKAEATVIRIGEGAAFTGGTLSLVNGSILTGKGTVDFAEVVNNDSLIEPGESPGVLAFTGDLTFNRGHLTLEIGGKSPGTGHDQISVAGDLRLNDGEVRFAFINGFAPRAGQVFTLFDVDGDLTGDPAFVVTGLEPGWQFSTSHNPATGEFSLNSLSNATALPPVIDTDKNGLPDSWEMENFKALGNDPGSDSRDCDGLANLLEYAMGSDPKAFSPGPAIRSAPKDSGAHYDYLLNLDPQARGVRLDLETSADLSLWTRQGVSIRPAAAALAPGPFGDRVTLISDTVLPTTGLRQLRFRVSKPLTGTKPLFIRIRGALESP